MHSESHTSEAASGKLCLTFMVTAVTRAYLRVRSLDVTVRVTGGWNCNVLDHLTWFLLVFSHAGRCSCFLRVLKQLYLFIVVYSSVKTHFLVSKKPPCCVAKRRPVHLYFITIPLKHISISAYIIILFNSKTIHPIRKKNRRKTKDRE